MKWKNKGFRIILISIVVLFAAWFFGPSILSPARPKPVTQELFKGVEYQRIVRDSPRKLVIHVVEVRLALGNVRAFVTPPDNPGSDRPLKARTTSAFLEKHNLQIAVNGDGFEPWWVAGPFYYPHAGDPVSTQGFAMSNGEIYSEVSDEKAPMLVLGAGRQVEISYITIGAKNVISGSTLLVDDGAIVEDLPGKKLHPRTAVGLNQAGTRLIIVVVDGRQPGYSEGVTLAELAEIMVEQGAYRATDLDGGGSSTLVMADENGEAVLLNSPVHQGIPGLERPVANHLGIYAKGK
jgi:hypothetical protein